MANSVLHFDSAHYLDLPTHPRRIPRLPVATGMPSVLYEPPAARAVAAQLAAMQGQEAAFTATSTLHLLWDCLEWVRQTNQQVLLAADSYPLIQGLVQRLIPAARLHTFHDTATLAQTLAHIPRTTGVTVVADSWQQRTNRVFALRECLTLLEARRGWLILDDTQTIGLLGSNPTPTQPFGQGGGGLLPWAGIRSQRVIVIASLAKALGTPLAVISGTNAIIQTLRTHSMTRTYCSPPSPWLSEHALHALAQHAAWGDWLRQRLLRNIRAYQAGLRQIGISHPAPLFPVQHLPLPHPWQCKALYQTLRRRGIRTLITQRADGGCALSVILHAKHSPAALTCLLHALHTGSRQLKVTDGQNIWHGIAARNAL